MNTFDIVFNEIKSNGIDCDIKKKDQYGNLVSVKTNELEALGTKSIIASTSKLLAKLETKERLAWALDTKDEANQLYKKCLFKEAMGKYVEALAAADFGDKNNISSCNYDTKESIRINDGNVDELIIPVLCNLSACCIELKEWKKAISFSEQALLLRPSCYKAFIRRGIGYLHIGDYELSLESFIVVDQHIKKMMAMDTETSGSTMSSPLELSQSDVNRLPQLMMQAKKGKRIEKKKLMQQRKSLMRAFNQHLYDKDRILILEDVA